jgi:hypothetical protein
VASQGDEQDELDPDVQAATPWRADERPRSVGHTTEKAWRAKQRCQISGEKAHWFAARKSVMSYWDPSLVRIARLETKVQGKKFGENQTIFLFIAMRNSNPCIDADQKMPRVSHLTQASDAQYQLRLEVETRWTSRSVGPTREDLGDLERPKVSPRKMLINPLTVYLPDELSRRRMSHRIFVALSPAMYSWQPMSLRKRLEGAGIPPGFVGHMPVGWLLIPLA